MIKYDKNNSKEKKDEKCKSVIIDIKREIPNDAEFEDYNISEKIQKFLKAATNEICSFCDNHNSSSNNNDDDVDCQNKKQTFRYKLKNICNSIKKTLKSITFTDCFSGMSCICCSEIGEESKHITEHQNKEYLPSENNETETEKDKEELR